MCAARDARISPALWHNKRHHLTAISFLRMQKSQRHINWPRPSVLAIRTHLHPHHTHPYGRAGKFVWPERDNRRIRNKFSVARSLAFTQIWTFVRLSVSGVTANSLTAMVFRPRHNFYKVIIIVWKLLRPGRKVCLVLVRLPPVNVVVTHVKPPKNRKKIDKKRGKTYVHKVLVRIFIRPAKEYRMTGATTTRQRWRQRGLTPIKSHLTSTLVRGPDTQRWRE